MDRPRCRPVQTTTKSTSGHRNLMRSRIAGADFHGGKVKVTPASVEQYNELQQATEATLTFCCIHHSSNFQCFSMDRMTPKITLLLGRSGPHLLHGSSGPLKSPNRTAFLICLSALAGLTNVANRQTHRQTMSLCSNRPHSPATSYRHGEIMSQ